MNALPRSTVRRASSYVGEAAAAVAFLYFVVGGASWPPTMWAAFCVFAVAVVVVQVLYDDVCHLGEPEHSLWRLRFGFAMVAGLLGAVVYAWSLWALALGVVLGFFWLADWRTHRELVRLRSQMGHRDATGKWGDR